MREHLAGASPHGVDVIIFDTPEDGIRLLSGSQVDLVVLRVDARGEHRRLLALAQQSLPQVPVIGVLSADVVELEPRFSTAFDELLQEPLEPARLGRAARNALRWRELSQQLREKDLELLTLDEVGRTIISSLELQTVLNIIMEKTRELVHAESWSLLLGEEGEGGLHLSVAVGEGADRTGPGVVIKPGEGIPGWVAREGKPVVVHDAAADPRWCDLEQTYGVRARSILCVPLETRGRMLGVIEVVNKKGGADGFTARDLNLVTRLAGFAAIAIENARLYQQTKQMSLTDELTRLYNARYFTQYLDTEVKRCRRYKSNVSLIFLDLDHFKQVNDHHGHLAGSQLLREVAEVLAPRRARRRHRGALRRGRVHRDPARNQARRRGLRRRAAAAVDGRARLPRRRGPRGAPHRKLRGGLLSRDLFRRGRADPPRRPGDVPGEEPHPQRRLPRRGSRRRETRGGGRVSRAPARPAAAAPAVVSGARPWRIKLLYQLLAVLLLVGVGPLAISSRKMMQINQSTLESGILAAQTQIVTSSAERVESFLGGTSATLRGMARFQGLMTSPDEGQRSDLLIPFLDSYNSLLAVRVVAADGRQTAEVGRGVAAVWEQLGAGEIAAARAAALRGEEYIGTPFFPAGGAATAVGFAVPVRDENNRVTAALLAIVSLADVQKLLAKIRIGTTGQAYLVDRRGVLVAHRDLELVRRRENLADLEIVGYLQAGQTLGSVPFRDRAGRQMLGAYDLVPGVNWGVVIEELRDEAYGSLTALRRQTVFWIALGLVLAIGIGISVAQGISRPIRTFADRALAISRGDFKGTITARSHNEIGQLADTFNHMTRQLDSYDRNMRELFLSTIKSLAAAIDAKDPYTRGHSERVALFSVAIAREMGLDEKSLERVQIAGLLHDVGKIGIADAVLRKPDRLTDAEFAIIKGHPALGASIMGPIRQLKDIIPGMRHHHEALDGTGYPDGLAGGEIPLMARIIAVADTFDAMTSDRLYQKAKDDDFVIQTLLRLSGSRYDPKVVQAFIKAHLKLRRPPPVAAGAPVAQSASEGDHALPAA